MTEEEIKELERLRLGAAGQREKPLMPSADQVLQFTEGQRTAPAEMDYSSPVLPNANDVALPVNPTFEGVFSEQPMMVTNLDLMGNPLRKQPSVEQIRFDSRPDRLASKELSRNTSAFFRGLGQGFMDVVKDPIQAISDATGFYSDPIANYMAGAEGGLPEMVMDAIPNDINLPTLTKENLAEGGLTAMEFVSGRDIGKGGYDFNAQGGSDAFKTEGDRISKTSLDSLGGTAGTGGTTIQQGQAGSPQANFVKRMATGQPLTQAETAAAIQFARSKGLNFDPRTGYSQAPMATAPRTTGVGSQMMTMEFRDTNQDGIEDRSQGIFNPGDFRGSGANLPTLSSVSAMAGMAPQGRPALSAYEQASMDRQRRIGGTGSYAGDSAAREARIAARPDFNEAISDRDRRAARGEGLSQADLRDLAKGSARGASTGDRARSLEIQQRYGMGAFKPGTPSVDNLSQATSTVDRMIQNGQLSPEKRNAAIQKIMGVGSLDNTAGSGSAGPGVIKSTEFNTVSAQLQPGGSLYNMGIRVDESETDPYKMVYRETPGILEGLKPGPRGREMVSPELVQQLLPYLRSVRKPGEGDFAGIGMQVNKPNQFAGLR